MIALTRVSYLLFAVTIFWHCTDTGVIESERKSVEAEPESGSDIGVAVEDTSKKYEVESESKQVKVSIEADSFSEPVAVVSSKNSCDKTKFSSSDSSCSLFLASLNADGEPVNPLKKVKVDFAFDVEESLQELEQSSLEIVFIGNDGTEKSIEGFTVEIKNKKAVVSFDTENLNGKLTFKYKSKKQEQSSDSEEQANPVNETPIVNTNGNPDQNSSGANTSEETSGGGDTVNEDPPPPPSPTYKTNFVDNDDSADGFGGRLDAANVEFSNGISITAWSETDRELPKSRGDDGFVDMSSNVLLLDFNGTGAVGASLTDTSGFNHDFPISGTNNAFASGVLNEALSYDRSNSGDIDAWTSGFDDSFPGKASSTSEDMTWMTWVNFDSIDLDHLLFEKRTVADSYIINVTSGNSLAFEVWKTGGASTMLTASSAINKAGEWFLFAATYQYVADGSSIMKLYVNGSLAAERSDAVGPIHKVDSNILIRPWWSTTNTLMDELAVFGEALSEETIASIYNRQSAGTVGGGYDGNFNSRVMDSEKEAGIDWNTLAVKTKAPYGKELNPALPESGYTQGNADAGFYTGLKGYWKLNGTLSDNIADAAVLSNEVGGDLSITTTNGGNVNTGLVYVEGPLGEGLQFQNEDTDHLEVTDHDDLDFDPAKDYTWSFWINRATNNTDWQSIWSQTLSSSEYLGIYTLSTIDANAGPVDNGIVLYLDAGSDEFAWHTVSNAVLPNKWYHVAITYDSSQATITDRVKIFVNGVDKTDATDIYSNSASIDGIATASTQIGNAAPWDEAFNGSLDDVSFWHRNLSESEVQMLFQRGTSRLKFQVRSCALPDCSDASFVGPDGSGATYYTEFDQGSDQPPVYNLSNVPKNRYFQYRAYFENRDGQSLFPVLESVTVDGSE